MTSVAVPSQLETEYGVKFADVSAVSQGLINDTWIAETPDAEQFIVQRLHTAIDPQVNGRMRVFGEHMRAAGVVVPLLIKTTRSADYVEIDDRVWRVLSYLEGRSYDAIPDLPHAMRAGRALARFHRGAAKFPESDTLPLSSTHDLARHLGLLRESLTEFAGDRAARNLAQEILDCAKSLPVVESTSLRVVHGDPKISNFLFCEVDETVAIVDLDTISRMPLAWELGDAFRSWCNPHGEDTAATEFSLEIFTAAIEAYANEVDGFLCPREVADIVPGILTIYVELAARFCADAICPRYFAWDSTRFESAVEHNLVRARGQLQAARDLEDKTLRATEIVRNCFA